AIAGAFPSDATDTLLCITQIAWSGDVPPKDARHAASFPSTWRFREERSRAGTFAIGGIWTGTDGVRRSATRTVTLQPGEEHDLGVFDASSAPVLEIVPQLRIDGVEVDVRERPEFAGTAWSVEV